MSGGKTFRGFQRRAGVPRRGFTLIELLVVISVVALLMALLVPALQRARRQAKAAVCHSNLRQWAMTLSVYTQEHEGRFPSDPLGVNGLWLLRGTFMSGDDPNVDQGSFHHFHTQGIALCPMATEPAGDSGFGISNAPYGSVRYDVEGRNGSATAAWEIIHPAPAFQGSYGYNGWLFRGFSQRFPPSLLSTGRIDLNVLTLRHRASIPVLLDASHPFAQPRPFEPPGSPQGGGSGMSSFCMTRHERQVNGLLLDWSARKIDLKELWTLKWYAEYDTAGPWTKAGGVQPERWPSWIRYFKDY
jgi:prepilin-type N-terminal cleavage/methylation domain-containing protein